MEGSRETYVPLEIDDQCILRRAELTVHNYLKNVQVIRKMSAPYGVRTYFFWQPAIQKSRKQLSVSEMDIVQYPEPWNRNKNHNQIINRCVPAVWDAADRVLEQHGIVPLTSLFDTMTDDLFLDWNHLTPRANKLIASACARAVTKDYLATDLPDTAERVAQINS